MTPNAKPTPFVSVIVPVYNDADGVRTTLDSLLDQTYPLESHEILVADNGSTDGTRGAIREFTEAYDHVTLLVEDEVQGPAAARNCGIRHADGEICAFIDADMTAPPDHLARGIERMVTAGVAYLACDVEPYTHGPPSVIERYNEAFGFPVERYFEANDFGITGGLFVAAWVFRAVGPFDDRLKASEDEEFGRRVHRAGISQAFDPSVTVYHPTRSSVRAMAEKHVRTGRGYYQLRRYYPERYGPMRAVFSPKRVLPLRPASVRTRSRSWETYSAPEKVAFYAVAYLCKLASTLGSLLEATTPSDDRDPPRPTADDRRQQ